MRKMHYHRWVGDFHIWGLGVLPHTVQYRKKIPCGLRLRGCSESARIRPNPTLDRIRPNPEMLSRRHFSLGSGQSEIRKVYVFRFFGLGFQSVTENQSFWVPRKYFSGVFARLPRPPQLL
jgi:hypothetical protein